MASPRQGNGAAAAQNQPDRDTEWYLGLDGEILGPMDIEELERRLSRCDEASDALVWNEGLEEWVEPRALPETAQLMPHETLELAPADLADLEDFFEQRSAADEGAARDRSRPAGMEELREFFVAASEEQRSELLAGASLVKPPSIPRRTPAMPEQPEVRAATPAALPRWPLWVLAGVLSLSLFVGLVAGLGGPAPADREPTEGPVEKGEPLPAPPVLAEDPGPEPRSPPPAPRPRTTRARPVRPVPIPSAPPSTSPSPGEEPLPATKAGKRKWLTNVQGQLRDLHKKRGTLRRTLAEKKDELPPEEVARQYKELRQMRFRIRAAHRLRGRLLEDLARDAPPLPSPP